MVEENCWTNLSNFASLSDVIPLVNCTFAGFGSCNFCYTDLNCDSHLSAADLITELFAVYLKQPFSCP